MEQGAVVETVLDVLQEVVDGLRRLVRVEFDGDVALVGVQQHLRGPVPPRRWPWRVVCALATANGASRAKTQSRRLSMDENSGLIGDGK